jgi:hypothetical protein
LNKPLKDAEAGSGNDFAIAFMSHHGSVRLGFYKLHSWWRHRDNELCGLV